MAKSFVFLSKLEKLNASIQKYNTLVTLFSSLKSFKTSDVLKKELKECRLKHQELTKQIDEAQKQLGKQQAYEESQEKRSLLEAEKTVLLSVLKKSSPFTEKDLNDLEEKVADLTLLLDQYPEHEVNLLAWWHLDRKAVLNRCEPLLAAHAQMHNLIERIEVATDEIRSKVAGCDSTVQELKELLGHAKCPTCRQVVSEETVEMLVQNALEKRKKYLQQLEDLTNCARIERANSLDKRFREYSIEDIRSEYLDAQQLLEHVQEYLHTKERLNSVRRQLNDLPKLHQVSVSKETVLSCKKALQQVSTQIEFLSSELAVHSRLDRQYTAKEREQIQFRYKTLKVTHKELSDSIMPLNETVQKLSVAVSTGKIALTNYKQLRQEISEIEKETEDYDLIQTLVEIYSPKGVRIQHISTLVDNYVKMCNYYAPSIFSERIQFSAVIQKANFSVLAERRKKVADVNSFSGSESRQFAALSALVIRMLMPEELRPNVMVFDEVEANLSKVDRDHFFEHFIPLAQKYVPTVVVITPQDDKTVSLPTASTLFLTRHKGITTAQIGLK